MRIRYPFAGAFAIIIIVAGSAGLLPHSSVPSPTIPAALQPNDKFLHLVAFFLLSLTFYWIPDISRRRTLHLTLLVCTLGLGVGSEILQAVLPNDRAFDPFDILANVVGSLGAVGLCTWYHRRMLERRRKSRYGALLDGGGGEDGDVELGVGVGGGSSIGDVETDRAAGLEPQESGVMTLEREVDQWDENAVDNWDMEDGLDEVAVGEAAAAAAARDHRQGSSSATLNGDTTGESIGKKRHD